MQFNFATIKLRCTGDIKNPKFINKMYLLNK